MFPITGRPSGPARLIRSIINVFIPEHLQTYLLSCFHYFVCPLFNRLIVVIHEFHSFSRNEFYKAAKIYLRSKITPSFNHIRLSKSYKDKTLTISIEKGEEITDTFQEVELTWIFQSSESLISNQENPYGSQRRSYEVSFSKKHKQLVLESYLPYVLEESKAIKERNKVMKFHVRRSFYGNAREFGGGGLWESINMDHPATFKMLVMAPALKKSSIKDLNLFVKRRKLYKNVGKAWKRGYLLYGPPGTGKSSLIVAMANYLKFDVYDLDLANLKSNSELRRLVVATANRSILVIEHIDYSIEFRDRQRLGGDDEFEFCHDSDAKLTLSGLLNFIDGIWASYSDERIIMFTTNHKDHIDSALLRPGRMNMQIQMSYCTPIGFKLLAKYYLGINDKHHLFEEIEGLLQNIEVTPAEVTEELMKRDNVDEALGGLIKFLHRKHKEVEKDDVDEALGGLIKFHSRKQKEIEKDDEFNVR